ncbi:MAG: glycosyltransferase [Rhodobacteraceae bacterium]|nr:glycosyltransferase [Paracoccaceae bacterium]
MSARHLIVMLKEPRVGRVKTRLGREIGMVPATWWFRHQATRLLRRLDDQRWRLWLGVAPDRALHSRAWPAHLPRIAQGRGDLGDRMARLLAAPPPGPALIVGGDIPDIRPAHIARAFRALGQNDAVFGPAADGGYWLVGLKRAVPPPPGLFHHVRWSTQHSLADSLATLPGARIAFTDTLRDIDTAADLQSDMSRRA